MSEFDDRLLISAPNGGGLVLVAGAEATKLDNFSSTGLDVRGGLLIRGVQPGSIVIYGGETIELEGADFHDVHDLLVDGDVIYAVATSRNEVVKVAFDGTELERWTLSGDEDSYHINCLARWNERIVFSAFGDFVESRAYKGNSAGRGFVQDLRTGERLITGLSQPHSLVPICDSLLLANSEARQLAEFDRTGAMTRSLDVGGYVRGLYVTERCIYFGLSVSRNTDDPGVSAGTLVALDRSTWQEKWRLDLPVAEIYSIVSIDLDSLIPTLARISAHAATTMDQRLRGLQIQHDALNEEAQGQRTRIDELQQQLQQLQQVLAAHDARIAEMHGELERTAALLRASRSALEEKESQLTDARHELAVKDSRAASLMQALASRDREVGSLSAALTGATAAIDALRSSSSWRITAPLRYAKTAGHAYCGRTAAMTRSLRASTRASLEQLTMIARDGNRSAASRFSEAIRGGWLRVVTGDAAPRLPVPVADDAGRTVAALPTLEFMRALVARTESPEHDLPDVDITVIIPVYRGAAETERCINSVIDGVGTISYKVLVIEDASPEPEITSLLAELAKSNRFELVTNGQNLGFVATVNRGIRMAGRSDVILLNSDTEVPKGWVDRLAAQAYSDGRIATVTPFSNNATICSYPDFGGRSALPADENLASINAAFLAANRNRHIEIPTAVGFCMYMKRNCIDEIGLFDEASFGAGYGEENDFCLRASAAGWKHILACDLYVFHAGEVSFGDSATSRKQHATSLIRERYPSYERDVAMHVAADPARSNRVAATAARFKLGDKPVVLFVSHAYGGGTERHVTELACRVASRLRVLVLTPSTGSTAPAAGDLLLTVHDGADLLELPLVSTDLRLLAEVIQAFGVQRIHVHHNAGFSFSIETLVRAIDVPHDVTVHDYASVCPRFHLSRPGAGYCGEPETSECNRCIVKEPSVGGGGEILWWRARGASLLLNAGRVICPSNDAALRMQRLVPGANVIVVPHERTTLPVTRTLHQGRTHGKRRIAVIGVLTEHKGQALLESAISASEQEGMELEYVVIGYQEQSPIESPMLTELGPYAEADLPGLIDSVDPDVILFPARCPETYSFTLTAALQSGRPVVVTNLGALPERVAGYPHSRVVPWQISGSELAHVLAEERFDRPLAAANGVSSDGSLAVRERPLINAFYDDGYFDPLLSEDSEDHRKGPRIVVIPEMLGEMPSPCSYSRIIIPLSCEGVRDRFRISYATIEQAFHLTADAFIANRIPTTDSSKVAMLRKHCDAVGAKLIYDIDDLLVQLPDDHPEQAIYSERQSVVLRFLQSADQVWTSSEVLAEELRRISADVRVFPNVLDSRALGEPHSLSRRVANGVKRILYMGTHTHGADLELVLEALRQIRTDGVYDFELCLVGVTPTPPADPWIRLLPVPHDRVAYPLFLSWLAMQPAFDFGIAPLRESRFNRCKSPIKFLEYSHIGIPTVASAVVPYVGVIEDGESGILAQNTPESWYAALVRAMADPDNNARLVARARAQSGASLPSHHARTASLVDLLQQAPATST
jgi:GT2 family glycosyltransferase/glycosyltransferase involved in cell wall biosynthesis